MRSSSRTEILDAALRVVDAVGGADITYESVAREAGLTKAGLMYHFPTKDALMIAVIEHVIARGQGEKVICQTAQPGRDRGQDRMLYYEARHTGIKFSWYDRCPMLTICGTALPLFTRNTL
jgi:AcrR family transcriptional regulator